MARKYTAVPHKTYATEENVDKAVQKLYGDEQDLFYIVARTADGRFYPIFIGQKALELGVQFHFNMVHF